MIKSIANGSAVSESDAVDERLQGRGRVIGPEKQYRGGGKRGRTCIKACVELRDHRWVIEHPDHKSATPVRAALQKLLREHPERFRARLDELEQAHETKVLLVKAAKQSAAITPIEQAPDVDQKCDRKAPVDGTTEGPGKLVREETSFLLPELRAISDPAKFAAIKRRVEGMKPSYQLASSDGRHVGMWVGVVPELEWLACELLRLDQGHMSGLAGIFSWTKYMRSRYSVMIAEGCGRVEVDPKELLEMLASCIEGIEQLVSPNREE